MQNIVLAQDIKPLSDFRTNAAQSIKDMKEKGRPMVLTRHGYGVAVVMDIELYEGMQAELAELRRRVEQEKSAAGRPMIKSVI